MIDRRGRTYARDVVGAAATTFASVMPIHAETSPGADIWTQPIDLRPVRVTIGGNDGWFINDNGFRFGVGSPAGRVGDGWLGYGGRQGQHWLWSRLQRVGYLHGPTRLFTEIAGAGAPDFNRDRLFFERTVSHVLGGETFSRKARLTWSDLWPALPQGQVDLELGIRGTGVKEFIRVSQSAREWIAANRAPLTPANETWFGFLFEIDFTDIPELWRNGVQIGRASDFTDVAGGIEMRTALAERLGFLTPGRAWVYGARRGEVRQAPALQRFWNGNQFFVGVRVSQLAQFVAGDLIIDPPQTTDSATGSDCGEGIGTLFDADGSANILYVFNTTGTANDESPCFGFDMTAMNADTVSAASLSWDWASDQAVTGTMDYRVDAHDVADATRPFTNAFHSLNGWTATTNTATYTQTGNPTSGAARTINDAAFIAIIQELVTSYGDTIVDVALRVFAPNENTTEYVSIWDDAQAGEADPTLSVTQTAGGTVNTRSTTDNTTIADLNAAGRTRGRAQVETIAITESLLGSKTSGRANIDSLTVDEITVGSRTRGRAQADAVTVGDTTLGSKTSGRASRDDVEVIDDLLTFRRRYRVTEDQLTIVDALISQGGRVVSISATELITVTDGLLVTRVRNRAPTEVVDITDTNLPFRLRNIAATDVIQIGDNLIAFRLRNRVLEEFLTVTDPLSALYVPLTSQDVRARIASGEVHVILIGTEQAESGADDRLPVDIGSYN